MAQSWRLAGQIAMTELRRRAIAHRAQRIKGTVLKKSAFEESPFARSTRRYLASERRASSKPTTPLARPVKTIEALQAFLPERERESTSNVPTPIARPVSDHPDSAHYSKQAPLEELSQDDEAMALPPSLLSPSDIKRHNLTRDRQASTQSAATDQSWYDSADALDQRRAELSSWRAQSKEPFSLESGLDVRPKTERHDSDESFVLFPSLSSRGTSNPVSSVPSMTSLMNTVHENLMEASPHGSMNLGSSSSSEPQLDRIGHAQSFFSYPSAAVPQQSSPAVKSSSSDSNEDDLVELIVRPVSNGHPTDIPPARDIARDVQTLAANNQLSFSSESEALSTSMERSREPEITTSGEEQIENVEASVTIVPPHTNTHSRLLRHRAGSTFAIKSTGLVQNSEGALTALPRRPSLRPEDVPLEPSDFIGTDFAVDTELGTPITLINMLNQLLTYHTVGMPDAQAATHFLLLLTPLLPQTRPLPRPEIDQTITVYSEHFATLGYTDEEIYSILQNSFEGLIKSGLQPLQAESIISTYHTQLQQLGLFNNAAYLRRLSFPTYPAVYEGGLKDIELGFLCGSCKKPVNNPSNKFRCENCEVRMDSCSICYCTVSPFELPAKRSAKTKKESRESGGLRPMTHAREPEVLSRSQTHWEAEEGEAESAGWAGEIRKPLLYSTCFLCNHMAHTACLRAWHAPASPSRTVVASSMQPPVSEGLCPTPGCLCACTPGPARSTQMKQLEAEEKQRKGSKASSARTGIRVKEDEWVAGESKAVQAVGAGSGGGAGSPIVGPGGLVRKRSTTMGTALAGAGKASEEVGAVIKGANPGSRVHERKRSGKGARASDAGFTERKSVGFRS